MLALLLSISVVQSKTPQEWKTRTIYQIVTDRFARDNGDTSSCSNLKDYCGGGFKGIKDNLDYIQGMGFDAIWISPVPVNTPDCYHGYCALDWYKINPNYGGEEELKDLIQEMHDRDMWIMLDVVANHSIPSDTQLDQISGVNPFNKTEHYHPYCAIDWNNYQSVQDCWLGYLADLNQDNEFVKQELLKWIKYMVKTYDIDGLRVDTVYEVSKAFWVDFQQAAGVYAVGEVFNGDVQLVSSFQGSIDSLLNYPLYYYIRDFFINGRQMYDARIIKSAEYSSFQDPTILGNFVDNHDNPRFLSQTSNINRYKNALAWTLLYPGIPIIYYGTEQAYNGGADPNNREPLWPNYNTSSELYKFLKTVIAFRQKHQVWGQEFVERWALTNFYCFSRGQALGCFSNTDAEQVVQVTYHPYQEGDEVCNVLYAGDCVKVKNGALPVYLLNGEVKLYELKSSRVFEQIG